MNETLKPLYTYLEENDYAVSIGGLGAIAEYEDPVFQLEGAETFITIFSKNISLKKYKSNKESK